MNPSFYNTEFAYIHRKLDLHVVWSYQITNLYTHCKQVTKLDILRLGALVHKSASFVTFKIEYWLVKNNYQVTIFPAETYRY